MDNYICVQCKGNKYQFCKIVEYIKDNVDCSFIDKSKSEWFTVDDDIIEIGTIKTITKSLN